MSSGQESIELARPGRPPATSGWRHWWRQRGPRAAHAINSPSLPADLQPDAPFLAACRQLRARLAPAATEARPLPLLLIGGDALPIHGLAAAGLALAMTETGRSTLLVDADLRRPMLQRLFGVDGHVGLADIIDEPTRELPLIPVTGALAFLAAGPSRPDAAATLSRPTLATVIEQLARQREATVFYTAGHWEEADLLLLAPLIGRVAFLVQNGSRITLPMRLMRSALEELGVASLGVAFLE